MAGFIRRKRQIPSLEALNIDTSDINIRRDRIYGYWPSRMRKPVVIGDEVEIVDLPARKPKAKSGPKLGSKIRHKTEPVRTMQAKPKPLPRPKGRPRLVRGPVLKVRTSPPPKVKTTPPPKVKTTPPPKVKKPGREARAYQPSQDEIRRVEGVIRELRNRRMGATMDTREEEL